MKAKARRVLPMYAEAHTLADHLCACSRACCGNPRRYYGERTVQERRAIDAP